MKCIDQLRADLAKIGATLDEDFWTLHCNAPSGYVWRASGCTSIPIQVRNNGGQSWVSSAIAEERKDRLAMGLEKITDPEELEAHRWELGDDTWGAPANAPEVLPWPKNNSKKLLTGFGPTDTNRTVADNKQKKDQTNENEKHQSGHPQAVRGDG